MMHIPVDRSYLISFLLVVICVLMSLVLKPWVIQLVFITDDCDDGNPCTIDDKWVDGVCIPGIPKKCYSSFPCILPGVCNTNTGECEKPSEFAPNGTACDDGNLCTSNCVSGQCVRRVVECKPKVDCHGPGTCEPSTGRCSPSLPVDDGVQCSDNDECTVDDRCSGGLCVGKMKDCGKPDQCHHDIFCNSSTGSCHSIPKEHGAECNDGIMCTIDDKCIDGICKGSDNCGIPLNECRLPGRCNTTTGSCDYPILRENGTPCNGGKCNSYCMNGYCEVDENFACPQKVCHLPQVCDPNTGECPHATPISGSPCNDGDLCTVQDRCRNGECVGIPKCSSRHPCFEDGVCDRITGNCSSDVKPKRDGTPCGENKICIKGSCENEM
eukprot:TRINITY_DN4910_c0_g1_i1.p1 TRINITY_DN4910_c0_g1~~TRINITY_DN4910_c0_g1_i1.p1  ORF type:complete len:382 (+),score=21.09 TRINITY_DN4910_c0_g1_i1:398-1543(+)